MHSDVMAIDGGDGSDWDGGDDSRTDGASSRPLFCVGELCHRFRQHFDVVERQSRCVATRDDGRTRGMRSMAMTLEERVDIGTAE